LRGRRRRNELRVLYRDALLLVFLALIGLRIGETLTLAQGLSFLINENPLIYVIDLTAAVTKSRTEKIRDAPIQINDDISFYRDHIRSGFRGAKDTKKFWLGLAGPLQYQGAYAGLIRLTERRAGKRANATDARHAIADASRERGDSKDELAELLGQLSNETAGRYYTAQKVISNIEPLAAKYGV
jgi:integrase